MLELAQSDWRQSHRPGTTPQVVTPERLWLEDEQWSMFVDALIEEVRQRRRDLLASWGDDLEALAQLIRHPDCRLELARLWAAIDAAPA